MNRIARSRSFQVGFLLLFSGIIAAGCMQPTQSTTSAVQPKAKAEAGRTEGPLEANIVKVNKFFSSEPWLNFESDGSNKPDGVKFTVYLEGPTKAKGVFGTGRLTVTMYRLDVNPVGEEVPVQVYEWDLPPDKAYAWRAKEQTALGWGYGLRLQWDKQIDLTGKQVAFVVRYFREDGKVITSSRQVMKVPGPGGMGLEHARTASSERKPLKPVSAPRPIAVPAASPQVKPATAK